MRRVIGCGIIAALGLALGAGLGRPSSADSRAAGEVQKLAGLLERAKDYCQKLDRAALDFTCLEKIQEKTFPASDSQPGPAIDSYGRVGYSYSTPGILSAVHTRVYDYQFVRKGDRKVERRSLVEEDGRKMKEDDAALATQTVRVENALFGPVGLFGEGAQARHVYTIVGQATFKGRKVAVIDAAPQSPLEGGHCFGRVWVREDDGGIVRISWDQTSVGNFAVIEARARQLGGEPRLTSVTEYGLEKNGLRFPSKDTTEEAYLIAGKKSVRSLTTIVYKDYKFFTVETEVHY